jgi:hypothetical protein
MSIFNRVAAGVAAVLLTVTTFALSDVHPSVPVAQVAYHGITNVAHAVLVSAVRKVEAR